MKLAVRALTVPWRAPLRRGTRPRAPGRAPGDSAPGGRTAPGGRRAPGGRPLVLVRIEAADGAVGHGEAAPLADYDGARVEAVLAALARYRDVIAGGDGVTHAELLARCAAQALLPQALAAVDLALWDLAGQRAAKPVWALLGAASAPPVICNATIGADAPAAAGAQASAAAADGFTCVKVKVGDPRSAERVQAVRAALGAAVALRLDANGAWNVAQAVAALRHLAEARLELCEEPVHGADGIAAVARALPELTIAADESAGHAAFGRRRLCGALCLKVARGGGISGVLGAARAARRLGYEVYLASTLDGPLGIAAALHLAAAIAPARACGLATLARLAGPPAPPVLLPHAGLLAPPPGPGLGDGLTAWYESL